MVWEAAETCECCVGLTAILGSPRLHDALLPEQHLDQPEPVQSMQGFIEGKYVPLGEGEDVTASMDIMEADSAEEALARKAGNGALGGTRAKIE